MKTKHSKPPWNISTDGYICAQDGTAIAETLAPNHSSGNAESLANRKLIVRAVNSHADLIEALQHLTDQIELGRLNIRKNFNLINAHAAALKAINKAIST